MLVCETGMQPTRLTRVSCATKQPEAWKGLHSLLDCLETETANITQEQINSGTEAIVPTQAQIGQATPTQAQIGQEC